jgi:alkanesulfonate monooxygenase SsuD/methylene tetrahydromethanopterin reductase-like flavin-dependent oxidoreductase (luciferase family)
VIDGAGRLLPHVRQRRQDDQSRPALDDFERWRPLDPIFGEQSPEGRGLKDTEPDGQPMTVKEAALYYAMGMGMPIVVGTPQQVADTMQFYMDEGGADGFMLIATYTPGCSLSVDSPNVKEAESIFGHCFWAHTATASSVTSDTQETALRKRD